VKDQQNIWYDVMTAEIIRRTVKHDACCIDVGALRGAFVDVMLAHAPEGRILAFEPVPDLFAELERKYVDVENVLLYPYAVSDTSGTSSFAHVVSNPAYSGLRKRVYDRAEEEVAQISVKTARLDDFVDRSQSVPFIKIDVEGAELSVMRGGAETIRRNKPIVVFEFGAKSATAYGVGPDELFSFVTEDLGLEISFVRSFLSKGPSLSRDAFRDNFENGMEYCFVAHSAHASR
jgi:FkbM family methyltransferase